VPEVDVSRSRWSRTALRTERRRSARSRLIAVLSLCLGGDIAPMKTSCIPGPERVASPPAQEWPEMLNFMLTPTFK
jgi:hypothetical protein